MSGSTCLSIMTHDLVLSYTVAKFEELSAFCVVPTFEAGHS